jgi:hypothetical protein
VHSKGLKFGIYSSPCEKTCGGYAGSLGHEAQDARLFASWGVDYLKYDLCSFHRHMEGKPEAGQTAIALVNTLNHSLSARLDFKALGLHGSVAARDLWQHRDLGSIGAQREFEVPSLGVVLLRLVKPTAH